MKKAMLLSGLAAGVMLSVVGCGGTGDGQSIVGTWHKSCYKSEDGSYRIKDGAFKSDKTGAVTNNEFSDSKCKELTEREQYTFTYKTGGAAVDNNGKATIELDIVYKDSHGEYPRYTMYRFKENGNLLIAGRSDEHSGHDKTDRRDHISPHWNGYTRVK